MVFRGGPSLSSILAMVRLSSSKIINWVYGCLVILASVYSHPYSRPLMRSELPIENLQNKLILFYFSGWKKNTLFNAFLEYVTQLFFFSKLWKFSHYLHLAKFHLSSDTSNDASKWRQSISTRSFFFYRIQSFTFQYSIDVHVQVKSEKEKVMLSFRKVLYFSYPIVNHKKRMIWHLKVVQDKELRKRSINPKIWKLSFFIKKT